MMSEWRDTDSAAKQRFGRNAGSQRTADALLVVAMVAIVALYIASRRGAESEMPEKVVDSAEDELYLTAGGAYTTADIVANGNQTASQRFKGFRAKHDFNPKPGEKICPITRTKANPSCSWIIGGSEYYFCCPPCIDEFLMTAKSDASKIEPPSYYVLDAQQL
jgi:YHS domain-containing protein